MTISPIFKSEQMKASFHALLTYTLGVSALFLENYAEMVAAGCSLITTGFVAWHYLKSGRLKQEETEKTRLELELLRYKLEDEIEKKEKEGGDDDLGSYDW